MNERDMYNEDGTFTPYGDLVTAYNSFMGITDYPESAKEFAGAISDPDGLKAFNELVTAVQRLKEAQ